MYMYNNCFYIKDMDPLLSGWEKFEDSKGLINSRKGETDHSMSKGVLGSRKGETDHSMTKGVISSR